MFHKLRGGFIAILLIVFAVVVPGSANAASPTASFARTDSWGSGYIGEYTITNGGTTTLRSWKLEFDLPSGSSVSTLWDAKVSRTANHYVVTPESWTDNVSPGGSVRLGMEVGSTGTAGNPTGCLLNGAPCAGGPSQPDTTAPTAPTALKVTAKTQSSVSLTWTASSDNVAVTGYDVYRGSTKVASPSGTSAVVSGLSPSTSYTFTVKAHDAAGNVSSASSSVTTTTSAASSDTSAPTAPTGLKVTAKTSGSVSLAWTASTDNVGVAGYDVYRGTTKAASSTGTSATVTGLVASTSYTFTVKARDAAGNLSAASSAVTTTTPASSGGGTPGGAYPFAPYADMLLWPTFDAAQAMAQSGGKYFTFAFIVTGQTCKASWGGVVSPGDPSLDIEGNLQRLRAAGGDAIVSFGGASGTELAQSCSSASALAAQYQSVIDRYSLTHVDFDVEGGAISDTAANTRRAQAIKILQDTAAAKGKSLFVSFTLPVLPQGLTQDGINLVKNAAQYGVKVGMVNVMAMDYGDGAAPDPDGRMGQYAIDAGNATAAQLKTIFPSLSDAAVRRMVGVTPMIGVNDVSSEVFRVADAQKLTAWAQQNHIGALSMWSSARDKQCPGGASGSADSTCSSILQEPWAFSKAFNLYTG